MGTETKNAASVHASQPLSRQALFYMFLLAIQFGLQPIVTRRYTSPEVCRSSVIISQETIKFFIGLLMLRLSGATERALKGWTITSWISVAVVPAGLYSIQNLCILMASQNLDALTFAVLNQTKTLSAALCVYLLMGRKQSKLQIVALMLLLASALIMEKIFNLNWIIHTGAKPEEILHDDSQLPSSQKGSRHVTHGVAPLLLASFISGLAGALTQRNLQSAGGGRNAYLFSMELCVCSVFILGGTLLFSPDGQQIQEMGFFHGWTAHTLMPIILNSIGGIVVGLVIKHAGSVRKGFALIFGILLSGLMQEFLSESGDGHISKEQVVGGAVAALSLWMHANNPPIVPIQPKKSKTE